VQELLETDLVRRQLEDLQVREGMSRDQIVFNSALREFGLMSGEEYQLNFRQNSRQYQGYRKRASDKQKDKLKPIVSETHINNGMHGVDFFNVGRINLHDIDKQKKSTSLLSNSQEE
jgi:hypothetical protein